MTRDGGAGGEVGLLAGWLLLARPTPPGSVDCISIPGSSSEETKGGTDK